MDDNSAEFSRVAGVLGDGYLNGYAPLPGILLPRRIVEDQGGVEGASHLLTADERTAIFAVCPDRGTEIMLDFGAEVVGIPELDCGDGDVAQINIRYGEDLQDLASPLQTERIMFRSNTVTSTNRRQAFRYARLRVRGAGGHIALRSFRIRSTVKPFSRLGWFSSSDNDLDTIWETAVRTVQLCMQTYLEDGVKRDCCLWAGDLRPAALTALYAFDCTDYIAHNIKEFVAWRYREGAIPPMLGHSFIMYDYVAWWTLALHDYYMHSGDAQLVRDLFHVVVEQVRFLQKRVSPRGLFDVRLEYEAPFTDWTCPEDRVGEVTFVQALCYHMLRCAADMADLVGKGDIAGEWRNLARRVKQASNQYLWSEELGAFTEFVRNGIMSNRTSEDALSLAVLFELADENRVSLLLNRLKEKHWGPYGSTHLDKPYNIGDPDYVKGNAGSRSGNYVPVMINGYEIAAHFRAGRMQDGFELVRRCFGNMLERGATTFWESVDSETGYVSSPIISQCHSWSGMVAYLLQSEVLGIYPLSPGFETCAFDPKLGHLQMACGAVPTPRGVVAARIEQNHALGNHYTRLRISSPERMRLCVAVPGENVLVSVTVDGDPVYREGAWVAGTPLMEFRSGKKGLELHGGDHTITILHTAAGFSVLCPELSAKLYVNGSLKGTPRGCLFRIRGNVAALSLCGLAPILVDGIEYVDYAVVKPASSREEQRPSVEEPLFLDVGEEIEVRAFGRPLPEGQHTLQFNLNSTRIYPGSLSASLTDWVSADLVTE